MALITKLMTKIIKSGKTFNFQTQLSGQKKNIINARLTYNEELLFPNSKTPLLALKL